MIDLRKVEPLIPIHLYFDFDAKRWNFSCKEMSRDRNDFYHCADVLCRLAYRHFTFIGYLKNPDLPYPAICYPENILNKAMVCRPRCALLELNDSTGFHECVVCGGNLMKHPHFGITSVPGDWLAQDPRVLKHLIQKMQEAYAVLRKDINKRSNPALKRRLLAPYEEAEKIFVTEILAKCIL